EGGPRGLSQGPRSGRRHPPRTATQSRSREEARPESHPGEPLRDAMPQAADPAALKERVSQVLASQVAPALHMDGVDIEVLDVIDGVARVRIGAGSCCPSSLMTVMMGIEEELRKQVPEIAYLEAVP